MTILVTGASGKVGGDVARLLTDLGADFRTMGRTSGDVHGDLADPGSLDAALAGVGSVFLVWPTLAADHAAPRTVARLAKSARRIVYLSSHGVPFEDGGILSSHALLERLISESGVEWTFLRPTGFAGNTLDWAEQIKETGKVRAPFGDAARPLIHERDIAAVAAIALTTDSLVGRSPLLTGPELITKAEQVRAIGAAIGREVRFEEQPLDEARAELVAAWGSADLVDTVLAAWGSMRDNPEPVNTTVADLTGRPATPYRQWARDHAGDFR